MLKLPVITTILVVFGFGLADNSITGECSRFQYDLALVKKITEIEHDHEVMKYLLSRYHQLEDTNLETDTILESQKVLIQSLQAESKTSFSNIRSMQEVLTSQGNEIEALTNASSRTITAEVEVKYRDCEEIIATDKSARSGVYTIYPTSNFGDSGLSVYCDITSQGGGWIVFQRRQDGTEDFYRGWQDYKRGFGSLSSEFWFGFYNIHTLMTDGKWELLINMRYNGKGTKYAAYKTFSIGPESTGYVLNIGEYWGNAGDSLIHHNGMKFTTKDRDNDISRHRNYGSRYTGAWWYKDCHASNLNGVYGSTDSKGPSWATISGGNPVEFAEMKMRRKS